MISAIRGFVFAVIAAAVVATIGIMLVGTLQSAMDGSDIPDFGSFTFFDLRVMASLAGFLGAIAVVGMTLFAIPATVFLSRNSNESASTYAVTGFGAGFLVGFAILIPRPSAMSALIGGLAGGSAGIAWWLTYRKSRARPTSPPGGGLG